MPIVAKPLSRGRIALLGSSAILALATAAPAYAEPQGGTIVAGEVTISGEGSGDVRVNQFSDRAILNWDDFSIDVGESVRFFQPGSDSIALNRVIGADPSSILGSLQANGQIFLINPNGVVFGASARVDVGGLVVSTADIDNDAFMTGTRFDFDRPGDPDAIIVTAGTITAHDAGIAAFVAPRVRNEGIIRARMGSVILGGAETFTLDFTGDNLFQFGLSGTERPNIGTENGGAGLTNFRGTIDLTALAARDVVNSSVRVRQPRASFTAIDSNGRVSLMSGPSARGPAVTLRGSGTVEMGDAAVIDVAGSTRGGRVDISGENLILDGTINLDGGEVGGVATISASQWLSYGSDLSASGMLHGGTVSLSGDSVSLAGTVSANAPMGTGGRITIAAVNRAMDTADFAADASGLHGGSISYTAGRIIMSSGAFRAAGSHGFGGQIDVTAPTVNLFGSQFFAYGGVGGGRVRIGGEYQGGRNLAQDELANAEKVTATDTTIIDVSAHGARGNGGEAITWSEENTTWLGQTYAMGGLTSGNGGLIEVSSSETLYWDGTVETARNGLRGGTLLLDPRDIIIANDSPASTISQYGLVIEALGAFFYADGLSVGIEEGDAFGAGVSLDGNRLAVGVPEEDASASGTNVGSVFLFTFDDASFSNPQFAGAIGRGYVGGRNIDMPDLPNNDRFGSAVALDGTQLAIGQADYDDPSSSTAAGSGAVWLYTFDDLDFNGGELVGSIRRRATGDRSFDMELNFTGDVELRGGDFFGASLDLENNRLVVGAPGDDDGGRARTGAVYVFDFEDDTFLNPSLYTIVERSSSVTIADQNPLELTQLDSNDRFGTSVALLGDRLFVGADGDDGAGNAFNAAGAIYEFDISGTPALSGVMGRGYDGIGDTDLTFLDPLDQFGSGVSADGTMLAVGALGDEGFDGSGSDWGAVFLFDIGTPGTASLTSTIGVGYTGPNDVALANIDNNDDFGASVSLDGGRLAVGAPGDDGKDNVLGNSLQLTFDGSGAVYLFDVSGSTPSQQLIIGGAYEPPGGFSFSQGGVQSNGFANALSLDGTRLAVGAPGDAGGDGAKDGSGAVYLITFDDLDFGGPQLAGIIGSEYTGGRNIDLDLDTDDFFGFKLSLDGNRLAVNAGGDDGADGADRAGPGAIYLFTFDDLLFNGGAHVGTFGNGYSGPKDFDLDGDGVPFHGGPLALSLDGNRLAVGTIGVAGGAYGVSLFTFSDDAFSDPTLTLRMGDNFSIPSSDFSDGTGGFGSSVSLDGNRLAVGAPSSRAVWLFSFSGDNFSDPVSTGRIGFGFRGEGSYSLDDLQHDSDFGRAVSLEGDTLAVGVRLAEFDSDIQRRGAVRLFRFDGPGLTDVRDLGAISGDADNRGLAIDLGDRDFFGSAVSLDGGRLAVGAPGADGAGDVLENTGAVYFFDLRTMVDTPGPVGPLPGLGFGDDPDQKVTINPASVAAVLNGGTSLVMQASNNIFVLAPIEVANPNGDGGDLTLQAGKGISIRQPIITDNGDVTLLANAPQSAGVIADQRSAGNAAIFIGTNAFIDAGTGNIFMEIQDGAGRNANASGSIYVNSLFADTIQILNTGSDSSGTVTIARGSVIEASGTGNAIVIRGSGLDNRGDSSALSLTGGGRYLIYSDGVAGFPGQSDRVDLSISRDTWRGSGDNALNGGLYETSSYILNESFESLTPGTVPMDGNYVIFAEQPILEVFTVTLVREEGQPNPPFRYSLLGILRGDTLEDVVTGMPTFTTEADINSPVGEYPIMRTVGDLASSVGYGFGIYEHLANFRPVVRVVPAGSNPPPPPPPPPPPDEPPPDEPDELLGAGMEAAIAADTAATDEAAAAPILPGDQELPWYQPG